MKQDTTRPSLLSRVRNAGDREAWETFDEQYRELLLRYCRQRGLQEADAEDVRQIVMMGLARSLRSFEYRPELGRFRTYLGRVVRNAIAQYVSSPRSRRTPLSVEELGDLSADVHPAGAPGAERAEDELWEREWMHHHLRQAMARARKAFDPRTLQVFEHLLVGKPVREVAQLYGASVDSVYKIKQRVRAHLEDLVSEQVRSEEFPERAE